MAPILSFLVGSLLAARTFAEPFEKLFSTPEGWKVQGLAANEQVVELQIALQQTNAAAFEQHVIDISTPSHPKYGLHVKSYEELKRMIQPSAETVSSVSAWLKAAGIENAEIDSDWVTFKTTVGVANEMLDTHFAWYVSDEVRPRKVLRTLEYSVPEDVARHINLIQHTTRFAAIRANGKSTINCDAIITPQCLKTIYQIDYKPDPKSGSKAVGQNFTVIQYAGGLNNQTSTDTSGEASLNLQYIVGVSSPLPVTEFSTGGRGPWIADLDQPTLADSDNEPYLAFLQNVLKLPQSELPQVITTPYGENEQSVPKSYALSVCNMFAQLSARGVSVIFSSGDSGVGSACLSNDGKNTIEFQPDYPASCPFVTAVGATRYLNETATFFSSGGFSKLWKRSSYQDDAIKAYFHKLGDNNKPYFNRHGRGFPDVSAQSCTFGVYDQGMLKYYFGTSASGPVFAGIIALLNDARLRANKPVLGFLNPLLYANPDALNDVILGGSTGCDGYASFHSSPNGRPVIPYASWNATTGWDPVSGLGTPNLPKLLKLALQDRYRA
ncbi:hypothetical protein ACEQ8H_004735 [Pleosporales sp. CAS-2024a]